MATCWYSLFICYPAAADSVSVVFGLGVGSLRIQLRFASDSVSVRFGFGFATSCLTLVVLNRRTDPIRCLLDHCRVEPLCSLKDTVAAEPLTKSRARDIFSRYCCGLAASNFRNAYGAAKAQSKMFRTCCESPGDLFSSDPFGGWSDGLGESPEDDSVIAFVLSLCKSF